MKIENLDRVGELRYEKHRIECFLEYFSSVEQLKAIAEIFEYLSEESIIEFHKTIIDSLKLKLNEIIKEIETL